LISIYYFNLLFILIYYNLGTGCNDQVSDNIKKGMTKDFNMVIEDFSAKEMSTRICNMYDKWINRDNLNENRRQIIEEIKKLPKSYPIIEFEVIFYFLFFEVTYLYYVFVYCLKNIFISNYLIIKIFCCYIFILLINTWCILNNLP